MNTEIIAQRLREFAKDRDWEQFHNPKNLAMAIGGETGELLEIFQWLTFEEAESLRENPEKKGKVQEEIADIAIHLIRLSDLLGIDLEQVIEDKIKINEEKYPIEKAKGNALKYSEFD